MPESSQRLIVYDGNCAVCTRAADRMRGRKWTSPHRVIAFQDLPPEQAETMQAAGIEKQMLLHDPISGRTVGGMKAIREMQAASSKKMTGWLLGVPGISHLAGLAYRVFAANRRLLSPVAGGVRCDCDPEPNGWERMAAWGLLLVPIVGLVAMLEPNVQIGLVALLGAWMAPSIGRPNGHLRQRLVASQLAVGASATFAVMLGLLGIYWLAGEVFRFSGGLFERPLDLFIVVFIAGTSTVKKRLVSIGESETYSFWLVWTFVWALTIALVLESRL